MSFKAWGGLISSDIIPHKGSRFYSPLRSHGQIRLSRFGFLTSTKLMANWFSWSCNRWKCSSTLFWRSSSTVVVLRSAWSVWFETYRGAPAISLNVLVLCWGLQGAFGSRRTVAPPLSVLMFWCYAEVCMERLVRDVPWRGRYQS
jgi:hypothetical protein